tara:strand:- start:111 stop:812 length:702 start_codon:yes stop_codon:yes gene_type:complete
MPIMVLFLSIFLGAYLNKKKVIYSSLVLFYIISTPFFADNFFKVVEGQYNKLQIGKINEVDAIVVLGGSLRINEFKNKYNIEWGDSDRFFGGLKLYKEKKSKQIVFTGGKMPFNLTKLSEGDVLKKYAIKFGINADDILVTKDALNTFEESEAVHELLGENKSIILVTSAFHMKRAKKLFEQKGFNVTAYKVDYKTSPSVKVNFINLIPSASSLSKTEIALREILGRLYYYIW